MDVVVKASFEDRCIQFLQKLGCVAVDRWPVDLQYGNAVVYAVFDHFPVCHISILLVSAHSFPLTGIPLQVKCAKLSFEVKIKLESELITDNFIT